MGGHAFRYLHCPRIPPELYLHVREQTTGALQKIFKHVVVPTEMPAKTDYGDVDFLVSGFLLAPPSAALDWQRMVAKVKDAFGTPHGKRGYLNPDVMYFAIPRPNDEHVWIQIDVKVCDTDDDQAFAWNQFQLDYASGLKMLGSLIKPLGLTISPTGLHIRVAEMEATNFAGSLVRVTKQPADVLKILGLDKRFLYHGFATTEEIYRYFASTWVFNPAHYAARLEEGKYRDHLEDRSGPWVSFVTEWLPKQYTGYCLLDQHMSLDEWRKKMRDSIREKVFTMFPEIAPEYYVKRRTYLKKIEEHRLQQLLMGAIPVGQDGWSEGIAQPNLIIQEITPTTPQLESAIIGDITPACTMQQFDSELAAPDDITFECPPTPPHTPPSSVKSVEPEMASHITINPAADTLSTPIYLPSLPRTPPLAFTAHPPPNNMSPSAKLTCIFRWTHFSPTTSAPYLSRSPREKNFLMSWSDSGATDAVLVQWVKEMWWGIWVRQAHVNYVGMWKRRFEKEDRKAEEVSAEMAKVEAEMETKEKAQIELEARKAKIYERLRVINGD